MASLSLRHVSKSYGAQRVFADFDLEVRDGELLCLLGPSGSGKTTLIRLIAGLESMQGGEILLDGQEISQLEPRARHIGMTFQGYALYPHLSVRQNLAYPLKVRRVVRQEATARVAETAHLLGISHLLDRRIQQISGGEQQRVAIGRAIVQKPSLYLLDEPISNLDASLRESVRGEIRRLQRALKATMIIVTHDQLDALAIADRIAVLRNGVLMQLAAPEELFVAPANLFVAAFLGRMRMNLLAGRLGYDGLPGLHGAGFTLPLPQSLRRALPAGGSEITLGIRPEAIAVLAHPDPEAVAAEITAMQFQGEDIVCTAAFGEATVTLVLPNAAGFAPGSRVWLRPHPDRLHVFDTRTGARLAHAGAPGWPGSGSQTELAAGTAPANGGRS